MKISVASLLKYLEPKFVIEVVGEISSELRLERPLFVTEESEWEDDNRVYLADVNTPIRPPERQTNGLLIFMGELNAQLRSKFEAVFIIKNAESIFSLHNEVQSVFNIFESWDADMQHILNTTRNFQDMLDRSDVIFGNPLLLHTKEFVNIAFSSDYKHTPGDSEHLEYISSFKLDPTYVETYTKTEPTIYPAHITGYRSLYVNIFDQGRYQNRILITELARELADTDGPLLEHLASYIKLALLDSRGDDKIEIITLENTLQNVLQGDFTDPFYVETKLNEYGWRKDQSYFCMKILPDLLDIQNHTVHFLCEGLASLIKGSCVFTHKNNIAVFVNLGLFGSGSAAAVKNITNFLRDGNLRVGISQEFSGFSELGLYYKQAEIALSVGLRNKPHIWVHRFWEVMELVILESCSSRLPTHMICAPEILRLREYDKIKDTDYCQTLRVYLRNNLRHAQTSRDLGIHRSTLLYRLERVREIGRVNIDDSDRQWYLQLSFRLLDQLKDR